MKNKLIRFVLKFKKFEPENAIIIASEARGGSTWLMETLNKSLKSLLYWEPLHVDYGVMPKEMNLGWRPFLPEDNEEIKYKIFFQKLLSGQPQNEWTLKFADLSTALKSKQMLVKFVRANLLLPWLVKNFNFNHKPIFLVRHPIAVALSQIEAFYKNDPFEVFEVPDVNFNERYILHKDFLKSLTTKLEQKVAIWCIRNIDTINHPLNDKAWLTVYYEEMLLNPEQELLRISKELNIDLSNVVMNNVRDASRTDFKKKFNKDPMEQLSKWKKALAPNELLRLQEIFDYFNFTLYSTHEVMPAKQNTQLSE